MPMHDWTKVDAGIFHAFHHGWIQETATCLNHGLLPSDYYALPEQIAVGYGSNVFTVKDIAVRHVVGDRIAAIIEIVSPGKKSGRHAFQAFVDKACSMLELRIHLLIVDPFPPNPCNPNGAHAAIWDELTDNNDFRMPADKPLTIVAYECDDETSAYIEPIAVGDAVPSMPLFIEPKKFVNFVGPSLREELIDVAEECFDAVLHGTILRRLMERRRLRRRPQRDPVLGAEMCSRQPHR